jgi:hypothetical protein
VDVGDGFTPQTDITLGGDEAELIKHGSDTVVDISGRTWVAVANCRGYYSLTLTTGDTEEEGLLVVIVQDDSDMLPVKQEYMVLSAAAYDSKYLPKDAGFMDVNLKTINRTDTQETEAANLEAVCSAYTSAKGLSGTDLATVAGDVANVDGSSIPTPSQIQTEMEENGASHLDTLVDRVTAAVALASVCTEGRLSNLDATVSSRSDFDETTDPVEILATGGTAGKNAEELVDDVWDEVLTGAAHNSPTTAGRRLRQVSDSLVVLAEGTAQAGGATTITLAAGESATDDLFHDAYVSILSGTGAGQIRAVIAYDGASKVATVSEAWAVNPANDSDYVLAGSASADLHTINEDTASAANLKAACDAYSAERGLSGTALPAAVADAAGGLPISDTGELDMDALNTAAVRLTAARAQAIDDWIDAGRLDTILDALTTAIAGLNDIDAAAVNAEMVDVLLVDTLTENAQGVPPATPTIGQAIMLPYMGIRNNSESTVSLRKIRNDAGDVIAKASHTEAANVYNAGQLESGP